jgi:hypothetical protein
MSKAKKKRVSSEADTTISEKDIKFEKAIQYSGWFFLITLGMFMAYYLVFDVLLEIMTIKIDANLYSFIIFTGTSAALCFALSTKIRKNRHRKKEIFIDWIIAEFFFCMFAIFSVAIYQW